MFNQKNGILAEKTAVVVLTAIVVVAGMMAMWWLRNLIFILLSAYLLMLALQGMVNSIVKWTRLPRGAAVFVAYALFVCLVVTLLGLVLPSLASESMNLLRQINLAEIAPSLAGELSAFNFTLTEMSDIFGRFSSSISTVASLLGGTFNTLVMAVMLFVISIHFSVEHNEFYKKVYWFTSDERKVHRCQKFLLLMEKELGGWVVGQALLMLLIGLVSYVGFRLIGLPYALPLAILAGLLEIVPNVGPILAGVPAVILGFVFGGPVTGGVALAFTILVQQLENVFVVPTVMKSTANVNPLVSIVLILVGLEFFGAVGGLLMIPIYIAARTFYSYWLKGKVLKEVVCD